MHSYLERYHQVRARTAAGPGQQFIEAVLAGRVCEKS